MARNWLRHHVDAQDGQAVIRKIVVSPSAHTPAARITTPETHANISPRQARAIIDRARRLRETRERRVQ